MQGKDVRELRQKHGWTQAVAARYLGTSQVSVSRWECDESKVPRYIAFLVHLLLNGGNVKEIENHFFFHTNPH